MTSNRRILFLGIGLCAVTLVLDGCSLGGLGGPYPGVPELVPLSSVPRYSRKLAPPQIIYRIDENRYFEDVPNTPQVCANGSPIYYVDKILGIRSFVVRADAVSAGVPFTIDAANDQYLIGPVTRGNTDCSSGGGGCGGSSMPYSVDAGRTWKRTWAQRPSVAYGVGGYLAYSGGTDGDLVTSLDLTKADLESTEWTYLPKFTFIPHKRPIDTKFHCTENGN